MKQPNLRTKVWTPTFFAPCPKWQHAVTEVKVDIDLQTLTFSQLDYLFAVFASNSSVRFTVRCSGARVFCWMESVAKRSRGAAERYKARLLAYFRRYKDTFTEGYSFPMPPTPELRVIYDSAARSQLRPIHPCGTTLHSGWDGGEYHWRKWPLSNVGVSRKGTP